MKEKGQISALLRILIMFAALLLDMIIFLVVFDKLKSVGVVPILICAILAGVAGFGSCVVIVKLLIR